MEFSKILLLVFGAAVITVVGLISYFNEDLIPLHPKRDILLSHPSRSIREEFARRDPVVKTLRCDACLKIATIFDTVLEAADSQYPGDEELQEEEVQNIVNRVCSRRTFSRIGVVEIDGQTRLKFKSKDYAMEEDDDIVNWSQRMKNHCYYFATEKLSPNELYDMWLRISSRSPEGFEQFLCYGEGPFSDCTGTKDDIMWPGGDEIKDGDIEEPFDEDDIDSFVWEDFYLSSSASKKSNFLSYFVN
nr:uncharacterized protein LOC121122266 [Lepeophtheirus salmonis]